jgi:hypothetical protein
MALDKGRLSVKVGSWLGFSISGRGIGVPGRARSSPFLTRLRHLDHELWQQRADVGAWGEPGGWLEAASVDLSKVSCGP